MKNLTLPTALLMLTLAPGLRAETDVTGTYIQNPDFTARYAAWIDEGTVKGAVGGFWHQTNTDFKGKNGEVYMETWVSEGSKVGDCNISQVLVNVPVGTYKLTVAAQNIQQKDSLATQTGAYVFAGDKQTEVSAESDYSVTFSVVDGRVKIGFKTVSCTGNWVAFDNFRLYQLDNDMDAIHSSLQALITEAEEADEKGNTTSELQAAVSSAKALLEGTDTEGIEEAAKALERATLNYHISNPTGSVPTVVTNPFVPMGATVALGRSTVDASGTTLREEGFCWSLDPEPTVLDERTTDFIDNNGNIYRMEHLDPATIYYVRAYAMTEGYAVGYGDVVKIATKPKGTVSYWYNYGGSEEENYRINSSLAECEWLYNNVTHITGYSISCSYGAGTETADCGYGGSMRVGPNSAYQQTGTILHESNHGVGVGTTVEWYNSSALREGTSSGKWLGSYANEMTQFFDNNPDSYLTGDATHMWPYGVNGAQEDQPSPANYGLYYANVFITHALHIDGLVCSSSVGFASPSYVFEQRDDTKYYIKCEDSDYQTSTFLGHATTGLLKNTTATCSEALENDDLAWYITFNPNTGYYTFENVGTGKYIGLSSTTLKAYTTASAIQLIPSREKVTAGDFSKHSYWMTAGKGSYTLQGGKTSCSTKSFDASASASTQRWLFLTADELAAYDSGMQEQLNTELDELIANVRAMAKVAHVSNDEAVSVETLDQALESTLSSVELAEESYESTDDYDEGIATVQDALVSFLADVTPASEDAPFDISYLLTNAALDDSNAGWSDTPTFSYSCCEYYTTGKFDFNQTTSIKLPIATYQVRAQAFQRPGAYADVYVDYVTNGTDNVTAELYGKSKSVNLLNIYADATTASQGTGGVKAGTRCYIPDNMQSAQAWFTNGYYENSVDVTTTSSATFKLGVRDQKAHGSTNYWTCFDNFRLLFLGNPKTSEKEGTGVRSVEDAEADTDNSGAYYDLSGRRVSRPTKGVYIHNGRKVVVK